VFSRILARSKREPPRALDAVQQPESLEYRTAAVEDAKGSLTHAAAAGSRRERRAAADVEARSVEDIRVFF